METPEVSLYPSIHKGLRQALNSVFSTAVETDWFDPESVARLQNEWHQLSTLIESHHQDEEQLVHPLLSRIHPGEQDPYEEDHRMLASYIEDLDTYFHRLEANDIDREKIVDLGLSFNRNLLKFLTLYFAHMHKEDTEAELSLELMVGHTEFMHTLEMMTFHLDPEEYIALCGGRELEPVEVKKD
jgi:hypothetical protein